MKEYENLVGHISYIYNVSTSCMFDFITQSTLGLTCSVVFIYSLISKANHHSLILAWLANFIGVFFHELAHAIVGCFLRAKPKNFIVFPRKIMIDGRQYYNLGRVEFDNLSWYNSAPTALAPLLLLPIAYYFEAHFWSFVNNHYSLLNLIIYIYVQVTLVLNSIPSIIDFKRVSEHLFGLFVWIVIVASCFKIYYKYCYFIEYSIKYIFE